MIEGRLFTRAAERAPFPRRGDHQRVPPGTTTHDDHQRGWAGRRVRTHDATNQDTCGTRRVPCGEHELQRGRRWGSGGARGRERGGPTRSHPEPGRDPPQRRRVLQGRPCGRRGRCGHPPTPIVFSPSSVLCSCRGVEQRQLVGLITQRSRVRIPPPPPLEKGPARFWPVLFCCLPGGAISRRCLESSHKCSSAGKD